MTKAYDFQDFIVRLKAIGIDNAEVLAAGIYRELKGWVTDSAKMTTTPFDDMAVGFFPQLDAVVLPQIDKISANVKTP